MTPSLEGWPTKGKEASFPQDVRLSPLNTKSVSESFKLPSNYFNTEILDPKKCKAVITLLGMSPGLLRYEIASKTGKLSTLSAFYFSMYGRYERFYNR